MTITINIANMKQLAADILNGKFPCYEGHFPLYSEQDWTDAAQTAVDVEHYGELNYMYRREKMHDAYKEYCYAMQFTRSVPLEFDDWAKSHDFVNIPIKTRSK